MESSVLIDSSYSTTFPTMSPSIAFLHCANPRKHHLRCIINRVKSQSHKGGFLGFTQKAPSDILMNSLGKFSGKRFLSIFRFKSWWSTMWVGNSSTDLQMETQWALIEVPKSCSYVLLLPIIEGKFRSSIHPGGDGEAVVCAESGSTAVKASSFAALVYVHVSDNPYNLMKEAYTAVRVYLNTF
uniref:Uncharacterized protein n=1 Tax=Ananas comosus var. bracteatus TaxID=296719 RepID=A0A6V7PRB0_ANACO|nr:unnamed protein product [Ananas comosus var. bracteatus]